MLRPCRYHPRWVPAVRGSCSPLLNPLGAGGRGLKKRPDWLHCASVTGQERQSLEERAKGLSSMNVCIDKADKDMRGMRP